MKLTHLNFLNNRIHSEIPNMRTFRNLKTERYVGTFNFRICDRCFDDQDYEFWKCGVCHGCVMCCIHTINIYVFVPCFTCSETIFPPELSFKVHRWSGANVMSLYD